MDGYPHLIFRKHWQLTEATSYQLGECEAMIRVIENTPMRPKVRDKLLTVSLIKGAQATTAIEGNTLSAEEIEKIFLEGEKLPASKQYLEIEVKNVIDAFNYLLKEVVRQDNSWLVTPELILDFHRRIAQNLGEHIDAIPGRWREDRRHVGPYLAPEHQYVPELIHKLCNWIKEEFHFHREQDFKTAVIQAIVTHIYIEWIHPFADGNGRTGRLVEFFILLRFGLPSICSHILSNFYNETRSEYYRQINNARKERDITKFISYAVQGFRDGLEQQLGVIQKGQFQVFWQNHIYETFSDIHYLKRDVFKRKRRLILAVPLFKKVTSYEILSRDAEIQKEYAGLSQATLDRDLKELTDLGLLKRYKNQYAANVSVLGEYLPEKKGG